MKKSVQISLLMALSCILGGCTTSADVFYSEYRSDSGRQVERTYANRLAGSTEDGLRAQSCRVVVQRQIDSFGNMHERQINRCNESQPQLGWESAMIVRNLCLDKISDYMNGIII